jgi:hypothetical protein
VRLSGVVKDDEKIFDPKRVAFVQKFRKQLGAQKEFYVEVVETANLTR